MINRAWMTSPVWLAAGWTMIHLVWIETLIGVAAAVTRRMLRRYRPETRYGAALAAFAAMALVPFAVFFQLYKAPASTETAPAPRNEVRARATPEVAEQPLAFSVAEVTSTTVRSGDRQGPRWAAVVTCLPAFWMAGAFTTLTLLATGLVGVERMRRSSRILLSGDILVHCRVLSESLDIARHVAVGICDRLASPVLIGIVRPVILLPPAALGVWNAEQIEMVLLHELAHLKRWDNLVNLIQRVVESFLFFHPAAWWTSRWIRLERELCCDRLVVDRLGEPKAYAEMLVGLVNPARGVPRAAVAMANGLMMTRLRRILNMEDRSMTLSMPEGFGVVGTLAVAVALAVGTQAAPGVEPAGAIDQALKKAVADVEALAPSQIPSKHKAQELLTLAHAQLLLGDRKAALATFEKAVAATGKQGADGWEAFGGMLTIAHVQKQAGDPEGAQATLRRLTAWVEARSAPSDMAPTEASAKDKKPAPAEGDASNNAMAQVECMVMLAREWGDAGEHAEACRLAEVALKASEGAPATFRGMLLCAVAATFGNAGDHEKARQMIGQARALADAAEDPSARDELLTYVPWAMASTGDFKESFALIQTLPPAKRTSCWRNILRAITGDNSDNIWYDNGGIKLVIGADIYTVPHPEIARRALPQLAVAMRRSDPTPSGAQMIATIAHLQAKAGDFAGAWDTALSVPAIKVQDGTPRDGFNEATQPAVLALIAREQFEAGERGPASVKFQVAEEKARAVQDAGERVVAYLVLTRELTRTHELAKSLALLQEITPVAMRQPEPRRSRSLSMIVSGQVDAGDLKSAAATETGIRSYPKLEKLRALRALANAYEKAGDDAHTKAFLRRAIELGNAKAPTGFKLGPVSRLSSIAVDTFIDPDLEVEAQLAEFEAQAPGIVLKARLEGIDAALRQVRALPPDHPEAIARGAITPRLGAYGALASSLIHRGDFAGAEKVISEIKTPAARTWVLFQMANAAKASKSL